MLEVMYIIQACNVYQPVLVNWREIVWAGGESVHSVDVKASPDRTYKTLNGKFDPIT